MPAKASPLSSLAEFLPPAKGMAEPTPSAAPAPREAAAPVVALQTAIADPAIASSDAIERGQGRSARIQISLRLGQERHEQLRRISFELHQPVQTILERLLGLWMDRYDEAQGRGGAAE